MKFKFTVFAILLLNSSFAQKTKEVFNKKTNEMYEVLKSDKTRNKETTANMVTTTN